MAGFNFERDLEHQKKAVESVIKLFDDVGAKEDKNKAQANISNPSIKFGGSHFAQNLQRVQRFNGIDKKYFKRGSNLLDISMETGTGKTYTYTKMMFELNKHLNQSKFIVIVPTLSIKAGTVSFLNSKATKEHFRQEYNREIKTYIVESKKAKKNKKNFMPQAVRGFVESHSTPNKKIHVLIINQGMINSDTMSSDEYDVNLFDMYSSPFSAVASLQPIAIVDEPHKFKTDKKTWQNIEKFQAQWIFRYGATFDGKEENLLYKLSAVDAFNDDLVKGVVTFVEEFSNGQNAIVKLKSADAKEAVFEVSENGKKTDVHIGKKESMSKVHSQMNDVIVENLKKNCVVLSNGLEVTLKTHINPYSYSESIQDKMMQKTISNHFSIERKMLTRETRIKPISLFFIDDIEGYRDGHKIAGSLKTKFEKLVKAHIEKLLEDETHQFYREYLKKSLANISLTHGGYFSKDNSEKDDVIEKEINEILHDKEELLSLRNLRRFIFSKWTLREGWDNPNVFQICKLRSSGSVTSKLQEVGRGLRLPVNEHMSRVKGEQFELNYYVDFTEKDFAQSLVDEINSKSEAKIVENPTKLTDEMIAKLMSHYELEEEELLETLDEMGAIKRNNDFKDGGWDKLKEKYPAIVVSSDGLKGGKVRSGNEAKKKTTIRVAKYQELKELWETINQKVVLEYKIENEDKFYDLLKGYLQKSIKNFKEQGVETQTRKIEFENSVAYYKEIESLDDEILPISYMKYNEFLLELATALKININTLHKVFYDLRKELDINLYLNMQTIRTIRGGFNKYLLDNAMSKFFIGYNKISNGTHIHPTLFTDNDGKPLKEIDSSAVGVIEGSKEDNKKIADNYLFEEVFFDSELERENITTQIEQITVFTKIPKNSIKIPVAGGGTYSPDFAYVLKDKDGKQTLNLIVETKNKDKRDLYTDEKKKIEHARNFFESLNSEIKVDFQTQFKSEKMKKIIQSLV